MEKSEAEKFVEYRKRNFPKLYGFSAGPAAAASSDHPFGYKQSDKLCCICHKSDSFLRKQWRCDRCSKVVVVAANKNYTNTVCTSGRGGDIECGGKFVFSNKMRMCRKCVNDKNGTPEPEKHGEKSGAVPSAAPSAGSATALVPLRPKRPGKA